MKIQLILGIYAAILIAICDKSTLEEPLLLILMSLIVVLLANLIARLILILFVFFD